MSIFISDIDLPKEGFIELLIRDDGTVQQTGKSYRLDGTDYYTPYVGEMPAIYHAVSAVGYEELLKAAKAMHTWIFLNSIDEKQAYDKCGLSDEMNTLLGYGGAFKAVLKENKGEDL